LCRYARCRREFSLKGTNPLGGITPTAKRLNSIAQGRLRHTLGYRAPLNSVTPKGLHLATPRRLCNAFGLNLD
jgi:hypothetical protein